jgi:aldehyde decarbonylase
MPFYDYVYNTMDKSTDDLYERTLEGKDETIDVVHLAHPTTLQSIYHFRLGFASIASKPYRSKWYMVMMAPVSWISMMVTWIYGSTFTLERNTMDEMKMQIWAIPRYTFQVQKFSILY